MVKVVLTLTIVVEKREDCPRKNRALQHIFRQAARGAPIRLEAEK